MSDENPVAVKIKSGKGSKTINLKLKDDTLGTIVLYERYDSKYIY